MFRLAGRVRPPSTAASSAAHLHPHDTGRPLRPGTLIELTRPPSSSPLTTANILSSRPPTFSPRQSRRLISILRRLTARGDHVPSSLRRGPGPYRIQPVIFQKPSLKERLAGTFSTVAAFVVTFYLFTTFSKAWAPLLSDHDRSDSHDHHSQRQQHDSEAGGDQQTNGGPDGAHSGISSIFGRADMAEGSAEEDEDLIDEEDVLFVPLTYPKLIPGEFYAGTDPEWLTFVHIARDRELLQQIKESLVQVAGNAATHNPTLAANLGDAVQLMSYWIMHDFPYRAPPEYVRSGIEVGPDYVGWVTRVVTNEEASKIKQMYSFDRIRASVWQAWKIAAANRLLRKGESPAKSSPADPSTPSTQAEDSTSSQHGGNLPSILRNNLPRDLSRPSPGTTPDPSATPLSSAATASTFPTRRLLDASDPDFDIREATAAYRRMASTAKSNFVVPPRGVFRLHGLVELRGSMSQASIYASGYYQPQERKWYNVSIEVVSMIPIEQRPRG